MKLHCLVALSASLNCSQTFAQDAPIQHDAEFNVLQAQYAQKWAQDEAAVDEARGAGPSSFGYWAGTWPAKRNSRTLNLRLVFPMKGSKTSDRKPSGRSRHFSPNKARPCSNQNPLCRNPAKGPSIIDIKEHKWLQI